MKTLIIATLIILVNSARTNSVAGDFADGPVIFTYGKHVPVQQDMKLEKTAVLKVVFDVSAAGKDGALNRGFDSVARFLNMHAANGISTNDIYLAIVIHGAASNEMLSNLAYQSKYGKDNPNSELLLALLKNKVKVVLCGQSAAYHQIANKDLIEGVDMALSAMTAHTIFAAKGYSQNPF
jgi:intracellular sulfur oxidation DsrE/DsrF family protein